MEKSRKYTLAKIKAAIFTISSFTLYSAGENGARMDMLCSSKQNCGFLSATWNCYLLFTPDKNRCV
jgi:D-Tyr-tRNAtyr deacylase